MEGDLRCIRCSSSQTRCRIKTNDRVCYVCGYIWNVKTGEKVDG